MQINEENKNCVLEEQITKIVLNEIKKANLSQNITFTMARNIANYAIQKAIDMKVNIVFSVVDSAGNLVLFNRMDNSLMASIDVSINKAYTANAFKMSTKKLAELIKPNMELYSVENTQNGRVVALSGGYPYVVNGNIIGGIGVSGGSLIEDDTIAKYALQKVGVNVNEY